MRRLLSLFIVPFIVASCGGGGPTNGRPATELITVRNIAQATNPVKSTLLEGRLDGRRRAAAINSDVRN